MNDKKEIEIYVATDSEGLVLYSQEITEEHPCLNLQKMLRRIDMKCKDYRVRSVMVTSKQSADNRENIGVTNLSTANSPNNFSQ